jgi:antitoxin (DNA-binding transcriptional repressor) of toxin-antitoxin stability system
MRGRRDGEAERWYHDSEEDAMTRFSVAEAQQHLTDLVEKVAQEGETILLVDGERPLAKLVPAGPEERVGHLGNVQGWLEDDDPFFSAIDEIVEARHKHLPRVLREREAR